MQLILTAHKIEAGPFIQILGLARQPNLGKMSCFANHRIRLVISGQGCENARNAVEFLVEYLDPGVDGDWLNFGIAGSADFPMGALVSAATVRDEGHGHKWDLKPVSGQHLEQSNLVTVSKPVSCYEPACMYDMEGACIADALSRAGSLHRLRVVKLISDGPSQPLDTLGLGDFRNLIDVNQDRIAALVQPRSE